MSATWEDIAMDEALEAEYQANLIENVTQEVSEEALKAYLGTYGDAILARVRGCQADAQRLLEQGLPSQSLVASVVGMELTLRYFLLRPLIEGAILRAEWASLLLEHILWGHCTRYRALLPKIAVHWGIDLESISLAGGAKLWPVVGGVWKSRNRYVHRRDAVSEQDARRGMECVDKLLSDVLVPLAHKVGLSWPDSDAWCVVKRGLGGGLEHESFEPRSPFEMGE